MAHRHIQFSAREEEVLRLILKGFKDKEIGVRLEPRIRPSTVRTIRSRILEKCECSNLLQLGGLLESDPGLLADDDHRADEQTSS